MLLLKSDADRTMLHDRSATWPCVDRGYPLSTPASLRTLRADALRLTIRWPPSRLASVGDRNPIGGLAMMPLVKDQVVNTGSAFD